MLLWFAITRAKVSDMNEEWLANIKRIADEFKEITGSRCLVDWYAGCDLGEFMKDFHNEYVHI